MFNYLIKIEYDGTNFVGWQHQKNGISIQEKIDKALSKVLKTNVKIIGAGRTDKGVHAMGQHANFKTRKKIEDKKKFLNSINFFLNQNSISLIDLKKKKLDFHSRFSAKERVYRYCIVNRISPLSLDKNRAWHIKNKIDMKKLIEGSRLLKGTHNFSTFRASTCSAKSATKEMKNVKVKKIGDKIYITFCSKSFLQNQVRSMVGCLKYLAEGKWNIKKFKKIFKSKKRSMCAPPAPPHGLYLMNVKY